MPSGNQHRHHSSPAGGTENHYVRLLAMIALSFLAMYILMYAMVDSTSEIYNNANQVYMAGLMVAPMVVIELLLMSSMYRQKRLNALLVSASVLVGVTCFTFIRQQTLVGDSQFLRSMIPHHSGAILMCQGANLSDDRIKKLCTAIIASQRSEIDQMRNLLDETGSR